MKKNYYSDEESRVDLKYGEIYEFESGVKCIYLGNDLNGKGRLLYRVNDRPVILSFNISKATLEKKVLNGRFYNLFLNDKEKSFALEILTKKGL